jgi:hypothetical protein
MSQAILTGRWVVIMPGRYEPGRNCAYCGSYYDNGRCTPVACLLCRTIQCSGNGSGDGCCRLCSHGYLPGWSRTTREAQCGYAGCLQPAAGWVTRSKPACLHHATGRLAAHVAERIAYRDAGGAGHLRWEWRDYGVLVGNRA